MTRRVGPEELLDDGGPLYAEPVKAARARGHRAAKSAAGRASRIDPGWRSSALAIVREYARTHQRFLAEHVPLSVPQGSDRRAIGHVFRDAEREGWIEADGFAAAASSNGSAKVAWKSLLYRAAIECDVTPEAKR